MNSHSSMKQRTQKRSARNRRRRGKGDAPSSILPVQILGQPHEMNPRFGLSALGDVFYNRPKHTRVLQVSKKAVCPFKSLSDTETKVKIIFRNATDQKLKLCWVDEDGHLHHFYDILPCKVTIISDDEVEDTDAVSSSSQPQENPTLTLNACHVEHSFLGHAFVFLSHEDEDHEQYPNGYRMVAGYRPKCTFIQKNWHKENLKDNTNIDKTNQETSQNSNEEDEEPNMHLVTISRQYLSTTGSENKKGRTSDNESITPTNPCGYWEYTLLVEEAHLDDTPYDTSNKVYEDFEWGPSWPIKCEQGLFLKSDDLGEEEEGCKWICHPSVENGKQMLRCFKRFCVDLEAAAAKLPPHALKLLKASTPFYVNKTQYYGRKAAPITNEANLCYHPDAEWLRSNGLSVDKCGTVELSRLHEYDDDVDLWYGLGGVLVHELAHAWHHKFVPQGFDNEEIKSCYQLAMKEKLYDRVKYHTRPISSTPPTFQFCKAYACEHHTEYFAELSAAYLGGVGSEADLEYNKWYPFNRQQVKEHDPRAYAMLEKMWGNHADKEGKEEEK